VGESVVSGRVQIPRGQRLATAPHESLRARDELLLLVEDVAFDETHDFAGTNSFSLQP